MAKTIKLEYKGQEYTLEYTRKSIETMERQGFLINELGEKPMSTLPALFAGAFITHHRFLKRQLVDEIYNTIRDKDAFLQKLSEMYNEPLEALLGEPEEDEGNASWEANW